MRITMFFQFYTLFSKAVLNSQFQSEVASPPIFLPNYLTTHIFLYHAMQISTLLISLLLWTSHVSALPLDAAPTLDDGLAVITSTINAAAASSLMTGTPRVPIDTDTQPIDGSSYFYVQKNCYQNTKVRDGFSNRGKFYETAYKDAVAIADAARKWPQLGTDASDKYVHQNLENSQYAPGIIANIKAAAEWGTPEWGFDEYIILTCDDPFGACNNKVGDDIR
jgi:hypothetical protein